MARIVLDKELKRSILDSRRIIEEAAKADCNEADTRRRIERILETVSGYDALKHLSRERAVKGAGETEHVDFTINIEDGENPKPEIMVEIKRVNVDLAPKHLKQVSSYAINAGCEWILLTNSKEWRLYHVSFGQPPITKMIYSWNILEDDISVLAERFDLISLKSVKKGKLEDLWHKTNVLTPRNLLQTILSELSLNVLRRKLRKDSGIQLSSEEIVSAIRRLLNEAALAELQNVRISIPDRKGQKPIRKKKQGPEMEPEQEGTELEILSSDEEPV